jgi:CMP-N,N'-diacetyllegionaminic acid synthase
VKTLAVIPARGGSKAIPRKNIIDLHGKPLIAWTIAQALDSGRVDYIHLSTDDEEIAGVGRQAGAHCDFLRPAPLAGDAIGTGEAILHAINELARRGHSFDAVAELQPTYCFRGSKLLADCLDELERESGADAVITCTKVEDTGHPEFVLSLSNEGFVRFGPKKPDQFARQLLPPALACKGLVLASRMPAYQRGKSFYAGKCRAVVVDDPIRMLDINGPLDLEIARHVASKYPDRLK